MISNIARSVVECVATDDAQTGYRLIMKPTRKGHLPGWNPEIGKTRSSSAMAALVEISFEPGQIGPRSFPDDTNIDELVFLRGVLLAAVGGRPTVARARNRSFCPRDCKDS